MVDIYGVIYLVRVSVCVNDSDTRDYVCQVACRYIIEVLGEVR